MIYVMSLFNEWKVYQFPVHVTIQDGHMVYSGRVEYYLKDRQEKFLLPDGTDKQFEEYLNSLKGSKKWHILQTAIVEKLTEDGAFRE
ncbi:hypothetical protein M3612_16475 [Niallia taxi]|uniref:hypothetical protein n=1 Tax=Niallia taxi TaxID=2499688 RepID=UPI00203D7F70|nr:hypothetical protein [Niallia taxi]MCM3216095.1 hypothetical protein [Niallia taxi]